MIHLAPKLPLSVEPTADPTVVELVDRRRGSGEVRFDVHGVDPDRRLTVEVRAEPSSPGLRVEVGRVRQQRSGSRASQPVEVTVPLTCVLEEVPPAAGEKTERRATLTVSLGLTSRDGWPWQRPKASEPAEANAAGTQGTEPEEAPATAAFELGLVVASGRVLELSEVLLEEYVELLDEGESTAFLEALREERIERAKDEGLKNLEAALLAAGSAADVDLSVMEERHRLSALFAAVHRSQRGLSALCFSGGGIRSATFNLGVLQGLVDAGVLARFDYLSSVSGGGYVSSWLAAWLHHAGEQVAAARSWTTSATVATRSALGEVAQYLEEPRGGMGVDVVTPEPYPIRFLRRYSNYLTPRLGALSADTWTVVAIVVRNLILNWLVFLPILAAALLVPLLAVAGGWPPELSEPLDWYVAGLLAGGVGLFFMSALRASAQPSRQRGRPGWSERFLVLGLLPLLSGAALLARAVALWVDRDGEPGFWEALGWSAIWSVLVPAAAFLLGALLRRRLDRPQTSLRRDLAASIAAGALVAPVYAGILVGWVGPLLGSRYLLYPLLAPVLVLGPVLLGKSLFVAFASLAEEWGRAAATGEGEREWWARWSAWTLIAIVVATGAAAIALYAPAVLRGIAMKLSALAATGGLGTLVSRLGKSPGEGKLKNVALALAAPLFCVALLLLVAASTQAMLAAVPGFAPPASFAGMEVEPEGVWVPPYGGTVWQVAGAILALAGVGFAFGRFVGVNRFSLQALYRNRLVRAYLGASNPRRQPNLFTGFDPEDDLPLHRLRSNRPWPVVNVALNLVGGEELAWQERMAESFTATPLHCGSSRLGYRRSQAYGGENGLTLGTAVATSGAAASPNMGYHSSPAITFIMALFNARLGLWLGNPGPAGDRTYTRGGPRSSAYLFLEALGQTDSRRGYVYLSDGGHFENLGLYEMVRRRCRVIVVCDAGGDPECRFDDLGKAIRQVRVDLGIPIEFGDRIRIYPKPEKEPVEGASYCALGTIDYAAVDGKGAPTGQLLYVKPTILDREPYDVTNYAKRSKDFPHESTADQWFDESQFESYRQLGKAAVAAILGEKITPPLASLEDMLANVRHYLSPEPAASAGTAAAPAPGAPTLATRGSGSPGGAAPGPSPPSDSDT